MNYRRLVGLLLLCVLPDLQAELKTDIPYSQPDGHLLLLDANLPETPGLHPILLLVHGGGWSSGDKNGDIRALAPALTQAGFTWFSIDYRLAPSNRWPACLDDLQTAIRWAKAHAAEYKGDSNHVALIGYSAGAHLVCQAAVTAPNDTRIQAVVAMAPPTDLPTDIARRGGLSPALQNLLGLPPQSGAEIRPLLTELSPIAHLHPGLPPFLLVQGSADKTVPYEQTLHFQTALQDLHVPCELVSLPNAPHRIRDWAHARPDYQTRIVLWLQKTLAFTNSPSAP